MNIIQERTSTAPGTRNVGKIIQEAPGEYPHGKKQTEETLISIKKVLRKHGKAPQISLIGPEEYGKMAAMLLRCDNTHKNDTRKTRNPEIKCGTFGETFETERETPPTTKRTQEKQNS